MSERPDQFDDHDASTIRGCTSDSDVLPLAEQVIESTEAEIDSAGEIRSGKLAGKGMWTAIFILAWPILLQQTMQACVGMVDTIVAGNLPGAMRVPALDGISIGAYIGWFIGIAMAGLGIGSQALIARAIGGGDTRLGDRTLGQSMMLSILWGGCVGIVLWFMVEPLAAVVNLSADATLYLMQYVRTICIAMPAAGVMMVGSLCLHGAGETTKPSLIAIGVNLVNIVLTWLFSGVDLTFNGSIAITNPFPWDLHVIGIALGTAASFFFGAAMTMWVLFSGVKDLQLRMSETKPDKALVKRIVRIGLPGFFESMMMWSVNLFVLIFIGMIAQTAREAGGSGEGLQGAHMITIRWEAFSFLPGFAMGTAAGALAGQYLGAGNPRKATQTVLACTAVAVAMMGLLGLVFIFFGEFLTRIVSDDPVLMENTPTLLLICGVVQIFFAITLVVRQGLRGVGDTKWTFLITTVSSYGVRLPAAWFFGVHLGWGLPGIWLGLCGEFIVRATLFSARFIHGGWKRLSL